MSDYKQTRDAAGKVTTQYDKMLRNLDEDLVKRLRDPAFGTERTERNLMDKSADRIEELEARLAKALVEIDLLQGKIDIAISAIDGMAKGSDAMALCIARETLPKLKSTSGEQDA